MLLSITPAQAQQTTGPLPSGVTPDATVDTDIYLSFRPNPVGLDQIFLVNLYTVPAPGSNRMHEDFTLTITKPSGVEIPVKINSYPDDGTAWLEWLADEIGEWTLKFDFLGTYFPAGRYNDGEWVTSGGSNYAESVYFMPASTGENSNCTRRHSVFLARRSLPTDYWTRPVAYEHREWWPILGRLSMARPSNQPTLCSNFIRTQTPLVQEEHNETSSLHGYRAPESAHVVWKRECQIAGIIGGDQGVKPANADLF